MLTIAASSSLLAAAQDQPASSKEQMHAQMIEITAQIHQLKQIASTNTAAQGAIEQLQAVYKAMSDQLGGDDPGRTWGRRAQPAHSQTQVGAAPRVGTRDEGMLAGANIMPPGCNPLLDLQIDSPIIAIPDNGTITRTVTISGLQGRIWYVDQVINITHTFCADLDITLTSPSGTTITITSDNGGSNDNVFNGTNFRDHANPGGQVPYTTNNGLVTDHAYVNLTLATTLCPEEPYAAFVGEDPNGVWTLTVTDDKVGDVGTLVAWDVLVRTIEDGPGNAVTRTFSNTTPVPMPVPVALASSDITVTGMGGFVCNVEVKLDIPYSWSDDLDITLTSPSGTIVTLTTDNAGAFDNVYVKTVFTDKADPGAAGVRLVTDAIYANLVAKNVLTSEEPLSVFRADAANGVWTLTISDDFPAADGGVLNSWSITITTCSCLPSCPGDINGDGQVNVNDLLGVIGGWGGCP